MYAKGRETWSEGVGGAARTNRRERKTEEKEETRLVSPQLGVE